jgi:hypothetical protein
MLALLQAPETRIGVAVITEATVDVDGVSSPLVLAHKAARLLIESAALTAAGHAGEAVENISQTWRALLSPE